MCQDERGTDKDCKYPRKHPRPHTLYVIITLRRSLLRFAKPQEKNTTKVQLSNCRDTFIEKTVAMLSCEVTSMIQFIECHLSSEVFCFKNLKASNFLHYMLAAIIFYFKMQGVTRSKNMKVNNSLISDSHKVKVYFNER